MKTVSRNDNEHVKVDKQTSMRPSQENPSFSISTYPFFVNLHRSNQLCKLLIKPHLERKNKLLKV